MIAHQTEQPATIRGELLLRCAACERVLRASDVNAYDSIKRAIYYCERCAIALDARRATR